MPELIDDLLAQWLDMDAQGLRVDPAELCRTHPELLDELRRRIDARSPAQIAGPDSETRNDPAAGDGHTGPEQSTGSLSPLPVIPGYQIAEVLGEGGFGIVFKAHDLAVPRFVAIKLLKAHAARPLVSCLHRETQALAKANHPNIVQIYTVGQCAAGPYIVMEFVPGGTLAHQARRQRPTPQEAAAVVAAAAWAVHAAHQAGVYHRDLKPANILLGDPVAGSNANTPLGFPKVADFGIAKLVDESQLAARTGTVAGTLPYMAPEQADPSRGPIGPATDVYGLGAVLYDLVSGRPPFTSETSTDVFRQVLFDQPKPLDERDPAVPAVLARIVDRCLAKEPTERFATAAELAQALQQFDRGETVAMPRPKPRRLSRRLVLAAGVVAAIGATVPIGRQFLLVNPGTLNLMSAPLAPLRIESLRVIHTRKGGGDGDLGETAFVARRGDGLRVKARLSRPAYAYALVFRPDGVVDACYPEKETDRPPLSAEVIYPFMTRDESYGLDEGTGLWVVALMVSEKELPSFSEWKARQQFPDWKQPASPGVVWWDDGAELSARSVHSAHNWTVRGDRAPRPTEPGRSAVVAITNLLKAQGDAALAVGFAVTE